ncbi:hypothetical protein D9M69_580260 [compost metagenome]
MDELQMMFMVPLVALGFYRIITKPGIRSDRLFSLRWRWRLAHLIVFALGPMTLFGYETWGTPGVVVPMVLGFGLVTWLLPEPWRVS